MKDGDGDAQEDGVAEQAERPDAEADECFVPSWRVFHDFAEGAGDEAEIGRAHV